jgi:hypothetical protein
MPAPPHDESGHTWHHPDRIWAVLAYIKSHWTSREVLDARAEMTRRP